MPLSRNLLLAAWIFPAVAGLVALPAPALSAEGAPSVPRQDVKDIRFNDPNHKLYFNYQAYLIKTHQMGETEQSWAAYKPEERVRKVADGEKRLSALFERIVRADWLPSKKEEFIKAVWGEEIYKKIEGLQAARAAEDPEQIKYAIKSIGELAGKMPGAQTDFSSLQAFYDGEAKGKKEKGGSVAADGPKAAAEPKTGFLESLDSKQVQAVLANADRFSGFLEEKRVPETVKPALEAMYKVLSQAPEAEKKELGHILPTVVRFLQDGRKITADAQCGSGGALACAWPGDYDRPDKVVVTPAIQNSDAVVVADILAHEFQHVYDMYTGRYHTMDTELRGFKVNVFFGRALEKVEPEKSQELLRDDRDEDRRWAQFKGLLSKAFAEGSESFVPLVSANYESVSEGYVEGPMPLRQTVDETSFAGLPRQLARLRATRAKREGLLNALEAEQEGIRLKRKAAWTGDLEHDFEKHARDIVAVKADLLNLDHQITIHDMRLGRMQAEVRWLGKRSGQADAVYDMNLQIDKDYYAP